MLSIEKCKKILAQNGKQFSDEEVKKIRIQLYKLAELEYQLYKALKNNNNGKRTAVCKSKH